VQKEC